MARPLPMVSPADWPAPTMIAILPCRRPVILETPQIRIENLAFVELDAEAVEHHRNLRVLARREYYIHSLALPELPRQPGPDRFGDDLLAMQMVGGPQHHRVALALAGRVGADLDSSDLV